MSSPLDRAPLPTAALSMVSVDTLTWTLAGRAFTTVAARADLLMVHGGTATLQAAQPVLRADHYTMPGPTLRTPRQLVPSPPQPEVTLMACAHARGAVEARVRLALFRADGARLIDKSLLIKGRTDRKGAPAPVDGLQLDYGAAVGGIGFGPNPLGRGMGMSSAETPLIFDPNNPSAVAGFCPIPAGFATRATLLGAHNPKVVTDMDLPEGFDNRYFHAAPADQRVPALAGDERLVLENLTEAQPVFDTRLPGLTAVGRLYGDGAQHALALRLESIHVDAEALTVSLVWRTTFASPSPARPTVAVQLITTGQVARWPNQVARVTTGAAPPPAASTASTMLLAPPTPAAVAGTMILESNEPAPNSETTETEGAAPISLPFLRAKMGRKPVRNPAPTGPATPWADAKNAAVRPANEALAGTLVLSPAAPAVDPREVERRAAEGARKADEAKRAADAKAAEEAKAAAARAAHEAREGEKAEEAKAAAERFAKEQAAARKSEAERLAAEAAERTKAIKDLKKKAYGGFDD